MNRSRIVFEGRPTKERREKLLHMIAKWRSRLLIEDWTFNVVTHRNLHHRDPDEHLAHVNVSEKYKTGTVHFYPTLWKEAPETRERTVMHEMIHAPVNRVGNILDRAVAAGVASKDEVDAAYEELTEYMANLAWDAYGGR